MRPLDHDKDLCRRHLLPRSERLHLAFAPRHPRPLQVDSSGAKDQPAPRDRDKIRSPDLQGKTTATSRVQHQRPLEGSACGGGVGALCGKGGASVDAGLPTVVGARAERARTGYIVALSDVTNFVANASSSVISRPDAKATAKTAGSSAPCTAASASSTAGRVTLFP